MQLRIILLFGLSVPALCMVPEPVLAQHPKTTAAGRQLDSLAPGTRVRIRTDANVEFEGILRDRSTAFVRIARSPALRRYTTDSVLTLARNNVMEAWYQSGTHWRKGARVGGIVGVAVGMIAGCIVGFIPEDHACLELAGAGGLALGVVGAATGAVVGAHIRVWSPLRF